FPYTTLFRSAEASGITLVTLMLGAAIGKYFLSPQLPARYLFRNVSHRLRIRFIERIQWCFQLRIRRKENPRANECEEDRNSDWRRRCPGPQFRYQNRRIPVR